MKPSTRTPLDTESATTAALDALAALRGRARAPVRAAVHQHVAAHAAALSDTFYGTMLRAPEALPFLSHEQVQTRLRASMERWLAQTFVELSDDDMSAMIARQMHIGAVHARIRLPPHLMSAGTRVLVTHIRDGVHADGLQGEELREAQLYATDLMHLADELMLRAYVHDVQREARAEEAYRAVAMRHSAPLERERARAALSEWVNELLFKLRLGRRAQTTRLSRSEFGNWLEHKARFLFEHAEDLDMVFEVVREIDSVLLPQIEGPTPKPNEDALFELLRTKLDFVRYLVNDLFERLDAVEQGRDAATGLLSRRHLNALLARELAQHGRGDRAFSVLLARVDQLDVAHGEGDRQRLLLQQLATLMVSAARAGDQVVRYGSADFLITAVETQAKQASELADELRKKVWAHKFLLGDNSSTRLTVSIGVAEFDGQPDPQQLLRRAEAALVEAMAEGGNRVLVAR